MSLEDLVTFVAIREADEIAATNVRNYVSSRLTPKDYKRNTKDVTNPVAQQVAATTETKDITNPVSQQVAATTKTKDVTNPVAQQVAATAETPPSSFVMVWASSPVFALSPILGLWLAMMGFALLSIYLYLHYCAQM